MSDVSALFDDHYNALTANGGAPKGPATWGEIWDANWNNAKLNTALGTREVLGNTLEEMKGAIAARTLQQFPDVVEQVTGSRDMTGNRAWEAKVLSAYAQSLPEEQRKALPFLDPQAEAEKRAAQTERDAADVSARSGFGGMAVGFAAEAAASIVDPVNLAATLATLPLGGIGGRVTGLRGVLGFAGREALANAAGQALQEPFVQAGRASLGLSYGFSEALGNIAFAGVAGAALHPVVYLRAGAEALRARGLISNAAEAAPLPVLDNTPASSPAPAPAPMRAEAQPNLFADITAADLEAAARHAEANAMVDGHAATQNDIAAMAKLLPDVRAALDTGKALPDALPDFTPAPLTRHVVTDADGRALDVQPVIVEASALRSSADAGYDKSLQPRDRTRAASDIQIAEIAGNLNPERLGFSAEADRGAPIIAPDNMVESGNGRITAIRMAYQQGGEAAARYRAWLSGMGVDVNSFKEPVLVRMRLTELAPEERAKFVVAANRATTLDFSASERALADAKMLQGGVLDLVQDAADLATASNRPFINAFMKGLPVTEAAGMVSKDGKLSDAGLRRIRNAIVASAYGDSPMLPRIAESMNDDIKSISNAMQAAAPEWARLRAMVEAGDVPREIDITDHLVNAASIVADLRANGMKVQDFLGQVDFLNPRPAVLDELIRRFYVFKPDGTTRAQSQKYITEFLSAYAREGRQITARTGLDLGLANMNSADLLQFAAKKAGTNDAEAANIAARLAGDGAGNATGGRGGQPAGRDSGGQSNGGQGTGNLASAGDAAARPDAATGTAAPSWEVKPEPKPLGNLPANNYLVGLEKYSNHLYRQTDASELGVWLPNSNTYMDIRDLYYSNTPDLATSQKGSANVMLEIDPRYLEGQINTSKPTWQLAWGQNAAEFRASPKRNGLIKLNEALRAVEVSKDFGIGRKAASSETRERRFLDRLVNDKSWGVVDLEDKLRFYRKDTVEKSPFLNIASNPQVAPAPEPPLSATTQSLKPDAAAEAARLADMQAAIGKYGDLLTIPDAAGNDLPAQSVFDKLARTKEAGAELLDCLTKGGGA